jgi:hypothetical protein
VMLGGMGKLAEFYARSPVHRRGPIDCGYAATGWVFCSGPD